MSVSPLVCLLPFWSWTKVYLKIWMRYLSGIFWRHSWDIGTPVPNNSDFFVSLSVCLLAYLLTEIWQMGYLQSVRDIFLNFFGDIPGMFVYYVQIILNFLYVCQSVSWLTYLLNWDKYRDISSSGWDILLKVFGHIPGMLAH